jgi:hypothetical protein
VGIGFLTQLIVHTRLDAVGAASASQRRVLLSRGQAVRQQDLARVGDI